MAAATRSARTRISGCENCQGREARLAGHALRFRNRNRVIAELARGDLVPIRSVDVQQTVPPGAQVPLTVTMGNTATIISPLDPDVCTAGGFNGYSLEVDIELDGRNLGAQTKCVTAVGNVNYDFEFVAPTEPGAYTLTIVVRGNSSNNQLGFQELDVTVEETAPQPDENGDGGLTGGPLLPCFLDPNRGCERFETIGWSAAGVLFAVALLSG